MKKSIYAIAATAVLALAACTATGENNEGRAKAFESTVDGKATALYTLKNASGAYVEITNYGGRIVSINVPDKDGKLTDVVLGYDNIDTYVADKPGNFGALIGRYGNRIENGQFVVDGDTAKLEVNNYTHTLHGGPVGYHHSVWDAKQLSDSTLELKLEDKSIGGFPGTVNVKVLYTFTADNAVRIDYEATTDKATHINLTNHSYFNLNGDLSKDVLDQEVMIAADSITPIDSTFMTHGTMMAVEGTPFDFRQAKPVGQDIEKDDEQLKNGKGYDHNFVLNTGRDLNKVSATVYSKTTGILMEVFTTEPGLQFYVGNFLEPTKGKGGVVYPYRGTVVMETQHYPNTPNQPEYPSTLVKPGETYRSTCIYKFSTK
ncbi:MAG: galactose mutarotase [Muribaculaceae bacterium]|nr:galactose mutarotase [Muribaculaceae bacterium]